MRLSFKKSIVLIILAAILIQVGSQFIYIHKIAENSAQRLLSYTNTTVKQIENNLDSAFKKHCLYHHLFFHQFRSAAVPGGGRTAGKIPDADICK